MAVTIENTFTVQAPEPEVWGALTDLGRVAPCMPGASLGEPMDDGAYRGRFRIKVGPVSSSYDGTIALVSAEADRGELVLKGDGTDVDGGGGASATIHGRVEAAGDGASTVSLRTELEVTGRLAQFTGRRSVVQGVADRVIGQFAANLQQELEGRKAGSAPAGRAATEGDALDGLALARSLMPRWAVPVAALAWSSALLAIGWRAGRRAASRRRALP